MQLLLEDLQKWGCLPHVCINGDVKKVTNGIQYVQAGRGKEAYLVRRHGGNDLDQLGEICLHQRPALSSDNTLGSNCLSNRTNQVPQRMNKLQFHNRNKRLQDKGL